MGNTRFNSFLNAQYKSLYRTVPITTFSFRRIAIDGANFMYSRMSIVYKQVIANTPATQPLDWEQVRTLWASILLDFLKKWMSFSITPIFIFDGVHPVSKKETQAERKRVKQEAQARLAQLEQQLAATDPLARPRALLEEIQKERLKAFTVNNADYQVMMDILQETGTPVLRAKGEGERLASLLCSHGLVAGVFSNDSDLYPLGCPVIIKSFEKKKEYVSGREVDQLKIMVLADIYQALKFNSAQLQDLYILTGCDYNEKVPGMGGKTAYNLIATYSSLEAIPDPRVRNSWSQLNVEECRRNFQIAHWATEIEPADYSSLRWDFPSTYPPGLSTLLQQLQLPQYVAPFYSLYPQVKVYYDGLLFPPTIRTAKSS
jgi:flap endonuclease-1